MVITDVDVYTIEPFIKKFSSNAPVVVMFYGANCGPCKATMPNYETLANLHNENNISDIKFAKYHNWENDEHKQLSAKWEVSGVPGFRMFYKSKVIARREGGGDVQYLQSYLDSGLYIYNVLKGS
jgi:thiol-disulfide isomerase/thioredoxin